MNIKQRNEYLKQIAQSNMGIALESYLNDSIKELKDASNFSKDDFEVSGKAALMAAAKLEKLIFKLASLKENKQEKTQGQYE